VAGDPDTLGEFKHKAAIEPTCGRQVEIFDRGGLGETGQADSALNAPVVAVSAFQVHQESQSFFESQIAVLWIAQLLQEAFPERRQVELDKFVEQGLGKHCKLPH
jgi:hypothetical protein